ncbi:MAG: nitronate monooxygenase [Sulfuricaulis sp.]|nr:nitronate monooxygenase [Sulfuricaulis sp.]
MKTDICRRLGCEVPIFAFSHCRDVVVEVTKAGGFGVLGAVSHSPEQLERELRWIDEHVGDLSYGVDVLIPGKYDKDAEKDEVSVENLIPQEHKQFVAELLDQAGIPQLPPDEARRVQDYLLEKSRNSTPTGALKLLEVAAQHPKVKLIVSALGAPPAETVARFHARGILVGALCGKVEHVANHREAGVDMLVAQGSEAGGHSGTISTMVLLPQIVDAFGGTVLAAGGISRGSQIAAAMAMGAQGVWCGTLWLGTRESELSPYEKAALFKAKAEDAVQRRCMTGKTVRMLKSKFSEAWEQPGAPKHLMPPLQNLLYHEARARIDRAQRADYYSSPAGQVIGTMSEETSVRQVMHELLHEYADTMERLVKMASAG